MTIPFNKPTYTGNEDKYVLECIRSSHMSGDGPFSKLCSKWIEKNLKSSRALLTSSCTHALEMAAILSDVGPDDEIIMPSYTFVSTANAFVLRGAKVVFVDIRPDTMNIDEEQIENAVTINTKAIVPVHYAGVSCNMERIMQIAAKYELFVIEDAAQGMMSTYNGQSLGSIGHFGAYSFHETKNFTSGGEGGCLLVNSSSYIERAEIIREKGTNRSQFFRGMVDKYSWVDVGSSYLASDLQAAHLWGQLEKVDHILADRMASWETYRDEFYRFELNNEVVLPHIPDGCKHNAHMFYFRVANLATRTRLIEFLKAKGIMAIFHYVPLHTSQAGRRFGRFQGNDVYTTQCSEQLIRLPLWYGLTKDQIVKIVAAIAEFFKLES